VRRFFILIILCLVGSHIGYSQADSKPIVGVVEFRGEGISKFASAVAVRVEEIIINSKRFTTLDRLTYEKVNAELEFQKTEAFLNSNATAKQGAAIGAQSLVIVRVVKMAVYNMKNPDGSINGHRASIAFTLKVTHVETGKTTEAESFQTTESPLMLSPESAVNEALKFVEPDLNKYFLKEFPLTTSIRKVLITKKDAAASVLIAGGRTFGFKEGDKLTVDKNELVDGKPYPVQIGLIKVAKIAGEDFTECTVAEGGKEILERFNSGEALSCKLIVK